MVVLLVRLMQLVQLVRVGQLVASRSKCSEVESILIGKTRSMVLHLYQVDV